MKKQFGKILCALGLHKWRAVFSGSILNPVADKCQRPECKKVRRFEMWIGYTYGYDVNDLPPHIPPPNENSTIL